MLFLVLRRVPRSFTILALLATNLVISMPAPPSKRSPEDAPSGFSNVPKILEIQLPLKIASKDDLVAWAKYVMGLMASRINITLTAVKETPPKVSGNTRNPSNVKQPQNIKSSTPRVVENLKQMGNFQAFATSKSFDNGRYAENFKNAGNGRHYENTRNPAIVRPLESGRHTENMRSPSRHMNFPTPKENLIATTNLPTLGNTGLTLRNSFGNAQTYPSFVNFGISPSTIQSPLEITANINLPRPRIREQDYRGTFDVASPLKLNVQPFVPEIPNFVNIKDIDLFRNANTVTTPSRAYLPVTTDSIKFPTDPFATRYFFDGVERNISSNLGVLHSDVRITTHRPLVFNEEIPLPVKSVDVTARRNLSTSLQPLFKLPFEAVITITRENSGEVTTSKTETDKYFFLPTREPPDLFPPYFDTNYTLTNESDQINVVFEDGSKVTETMKGKKKDQRKKQEKKKNNSSKQTSKKQNTTTKKPSPITQLVRMFAALRKNNNTGLTTELTPPPLKPQLFPTPVRTQVSTERPVSSLTKKNRVKVKGCDQKKLTRLPSCCRVIGRSKMTKRTDMFRALTPFIGSIKSKAICVIEFVESVMHSKEGSLCFRVPVTGCQLINYAYPILVLKPVDAHVTQRSIYEIKKIHLSLCFWGPLNQKRRDELHEKRRWTRSFHSRGTIRDHCCLLDGFSLRQGRRNQTSLAQNLEDDDDGDSNNASENNSNENNDDDKSEGNGEDSGTKESISDESEDDSDYDDDDEDEGGGSIKAIISLLQLVGPILEDLSDPDSDADIAEVIQAAIPILQDLSEGDGETGPIDFAGVLVPVLMQLSEGPDGPRDSGAILSPLIQLIAPLSGPLSGPLIVPLSRQISKVNQGVFYLQILFHFVLQRVSNEFQPPEGGGSNSGDLLMGLSGPLSEPTGPGKMSFLSKVTAALVSSLSKTSTYGKGASAISNLVKEIVTGSVAGSSAGSSRNKDTYGAPTSYGGDHGNSYGPVLDYSQIRYPKLKYEIKFNLPCDLRPSNLLSHSVTLCLSTFQPGPPSSNVNPLDLLGSSIKDILNAIVKVVATLVSAIAGLLGASSGGSSESPPPAYGPPSTRPSTYGAPSSYMVAPRQPLTGNTHMIYEEENEYVQVIIHYGRVIIQGCRTRHQPRLLSIRPDSRLDPFHTIKHFFARIFQSMTNHRNSYPNFHFLSTDEGILTFREIDTLQTVACMTLVK
ncbi:uncharacterized protein LOC143180190 [Calliopsis andreniformis]|uniref:uncharacterized protein LOC143180190 n=1 Tax=Calliopsis andreniformis TaxID=337506 RepID=UPI003FCE1589